MERRKYETEEEKNRLIPELRGVSREEYLKKREEKKLQELKDELEDEMLLFGVSYPRLIFPCITLTRGLEQEGLLRKPSASLSSPM